MYIEPNTDLYILSGCPLNDNYEHTILFASENEQFAYFNSLAKYRLTNNSYVRYNDGVVKVQIKTEDLYDCDYIMFRNTSYGNKWFYGFITSVEYINNITTAVAFELDVMQTWHFNYTLEQCYVEREHSATDRVGENTIPEDLQIGEYQTNSVVELLPTAVHICAICTEDVRGTGYPNPIPPGSYNGALQSCYFYDFGPATLPSTFSSLSTFLQAVAMDEATAQRSKAQVVSVFTQPDFTGKGSPMTAYDMALPANILPVSVRNNKLYSYPYSCCVVQADGQADVLRYEFFNGEPAITYQFNFGPNSELTVAPKNYLGEEYNYSRQLSVTDWPLLPWQIDSWQEWLARNKARLVAGVIGGIADTTATLFGASVARSAAISSATLLANRTPKKKVVSAAGRRSIEATQARANAAYATTIAETGATVATGIASAVAQIYEAKQIPDQMFGPVDAPELNAMANRKGIYMYAKSIRPEYIHIVDEYFTMYGYATHRVKVPNRSARPRWNYTKTIGCLLNGKLPQDAADTIKNIYDSGVTFWKTPSEIGNYSLDNSV